MRLAWPPPWHLTAPMLIAAAALAFVHLSPPALQDLQDYLSLLALILVIFIPGYLAVIWAYPGKNDLEPQKRVRLSIAANLLFAGIFSLLLMATPRGLQNESLATILSLLSILLAALAYLRWSELPRTRRFLIQQKKGWSSRRAAPRISWPDVRRRSIVLAVVFLAVCLAAALVYTYAPNQLSFADFSSGNGSFGDISQKMTPAVPGAAISKNNSAEGDSNPQKDNSTTSVLNAANASVLDASQDNGTNETNMTNMTSSLSSGENSQAAEGQQISLFVGGGSGGGSSSKSSGTSAKKTTTTAAKEAVKEPAIAGASQNSTQNSTAKNDNVTKESSDSADLSSENISSANILSANLSSTNILSTNASSEGVDASQTSASYTNAPPANVPSANISSANASSTNIVSESNEQERTIAMQKTQTGPTDEESLGEIENPEEESQSEAGKNPVNPSQTGIAESPSQDEDDSLQAPASESSSKEKVIDGTAAEDSSIQGNASEEKVNEEAYEETPEEEPIALEVPSSAENLQGSLKSEIDSEIDNDPNQNHSPVLKSLAPNKESPQEPGTAVFWKAEASDPENDRIFYRFLVDGQEKQKWSRSASWSWLTNGLSSGDYLITVMVRDGNHASESSFDGIMNSSFTLSLPNQPPVLTELKPDRQSPQAVGGKIIWTAIANDADGDPIYFKFMKNDRDVTDWSSSNYWVWDITAEDTGSYRIRVLAKDGKHASDDQSDSSIDSTFDLTSHNYIPEISDLQANRSSPQPQGSIVAWTAKASDPEGDEIAYRFLVDGNEAQGWSASNSWSWDTASAAPGDHEITVQARDGRHASESSSDSFKAASFAISAANKNELPAISSLEPDPASPQAQGATVVWKATAQDPDGDQISYKFQVNGQDKTRWSESATWKWSTKGLYPGDYRIRVLARDGMHASEDSFDSSREATFSLISEIDQEIADLQKK